MGPNYQTRNYQQTYQNQGFAAEVPNKSTIQDSKGTNIIVKIVLIFVLTGLTIFSLPFIICGLFFNPLIPVVVIFVLVFLHKTIRKFLR